METTPSRWALRSGEAERIAVWCPGWGGPGQKEKLAPRGWAWPGPVLFPAGSGLGGRRTWGLCGLVPPACLLLAATDLIKCGARTDFLMAFFF